MRVEPGLRVVDPQHPVDDVGEGSASPGAYVREQRKRRGMSLEQLAVATKIPKRQLALLEDDRFEEVPGPVFVKGFLRCCARALKLEEETVLGLLYEQERAQLLARRREPTAPNATAARSPAARRGSVKAVFGLFEGLPSHRLLLWAIVILLVALIVMVAFALVVASGSALVQS